MVYTFMQMQVQDAPLPLFNTLVAGDIIDSTHVVKTGLDSVFELFELLLHVAIHFDDIFRPFEYPREWTTERNYSWNEAYALRAFLSYISRKIATRRAPFAGRRESTSH